MVEDAIAWDTSVVQSIKQLWDDPAMRDLYNRRLKNEYYVLPLESCNYFMQNIDRLANGDSLPTFNDALMLGCFGNEICHLTEQTLIDPTDGHATIFITMNHRLFHWGKIGHQFECVDCVVFVVSLNRILEIYIQDDTLGYMDNILRFFDDVSRSPWHSGKPILVLWNFFDVFERTLEHVDMKIVFHDYSGGANVENAIAYLEAKFRSYSQRPAEQVTFLRTVATESSFLPRFLAEISNFTKR